MRHPVAQVCLQRVVVGVPGRSPHDDAGVSAIGRKELRRDEADERSLHVAVAGVVASGLVLADKCRNILRGGPYRNLVDVQILLQVPAQGSNIAHAENRARRKLLLNSQAVLFHLRPFPHGRYVGETNWPERTRSDALISGHVERVQVRRGRRIPVESGASMQGIARVPIQGVAAADRCPAFTERIPGEPDAGRNGPARTGRAAPGNRSRSTLQQSIAVSERRRPGPGNQVAIDVELRLLAGIVL